MASCSILYQKNGKSHSLRKTLRVALTENNAASAALTILNHMNNMLIIVEDENPHVTFKRIRTLDIVARVERVSKT